MHHDAGLLPSEIRSVALIGMGSVGASWTALFLAHDLEVIAHDPGSQAEQRARDFVNAAWPALSALGVAHTPKPPLQKLRFVATAAEAARAADVIQENVPERPELKTRIVAQIDSAASAEKIILSSTGGIAPSVLQAGCVHPERLVVVHPLHPAHLIPLVEVVGGRQTSPAVIDWAIDFARLMGKQPIRLNAEANGHMTNRLQFALVREAVACLLDGMASASDIDIAVRYGLGVRWALMGSLLTLHLAGGPGGMSGILDHAGKAIEEWWTPGRQPHLTAEVIARLVGAAEEVSAGQPIAEWERWRDRSLIALLEFLKSTAAGPTQGALSEGKPR